MQITPHRTFTQNTQGTVKIQLLRKISKLHGLYLSLSRLKKKTKKLVV